MATPTSDELNKAKTNIKNILDLNEDLHSYGQDQIFEAFLRITGSTSNQFNPAKDALFSIMTGAFSAVGGEFGPMGRFLASFLSGMVKDMFSNGQGAFSANTAFADYIEAFSTLHQNITDQLDVYRQDLTKCWDQSFEFNSQRGTISDLGKDTYPAKGDPAYDKLREKTLFGKDRELWLSILRKTCTVYDHSWVLEWPQQDPPFQKSMQDGLETVKGFFTSYADQRKSVFPYKVWWSNTVFEGTGWFIYWESLGPNGYELSVDASKHLYIDYIEDIPDVINPKGLFKRKEIFDLIRGHARQTEWVID
jgi:hypothetical protein